MDLHLLELWAYMEVMELVVPLHVCNFELSKVEKVIVKWNDDDDEMMMLKWWWWWANFGSCIFMELLYVLGVVLT